LSAEQGNRQRKKSDRNCRLNGMAEMHGNLNGEVEMRLTITHNYAVVNVSVRDALW
jgi:hypothetical protein